MGLNSFGESVFTGKVFSPVLKNWFSSLCILSVFFFVFFFKILFIYGCQHQVTGAKVKAKKRQVMSFREEEKSKHGRGSVWVASNRWCKNNVHAAAAAASGRLKTETWITKETAPAARVWFVYRWDQRGRYRCKFSTLPVMCKKQHLQSLNSEHDANIATCSSPLFFFVSV